MTLTAMSIDKKLEAYRRGHRAETFASLAMRLKGYRLLALRWRTPVGEIDLIMQRGSTIAFIEVKARKTHEASIEAVTPRQQRRIAAAANQWRLRHPKTCDATFRFDIISVAPYRWPRHHPDAFSCPD